MSSERELTTLEYVVMGFIDFEPQSGYSLLSELEARANRWSASPGSVYPMLKRLEERGFLEGEIEATHETRQRKIYALTPLGSEKLEVWLRIPLSEAELLDQRDIALLKFLFMEKRFSHEEVLEWLKRYELGTNAYKMRWEHQLPPQAGSLHRGLVQQITLMELEMQLAWIHSAQAKLGN